MNCRRVALLMAPALAALVALGTPRAGLAAPSSTQITIGVGTSDPSSATYTGGPIDGGTDAAGNAAPPAQCVAPACESVALTLNAPSSDAGALSLSLSVTFDTSPDPNSVGTSGLDAYILDTGGNMLGGDTTGTSPSVATASKLSPGSYVLEVSGEVAHNQSYSASVQATVADTVPVVTDLEFGPSTVVSPTILGAEPQISFERPLATTAAGAGLDPNRGFVDWPVSSRTQIGTLWRTLDGGDTYRQVVDLSCAERQVPNCNTGGGGDTVNRVNNYDGTLLYGDQESLAQEAFASSTDHGDSFPATRQFAFSSSATGVDRQWISAVEKPGVIALNAGQTAGSFELEALFSYHIPDAGEMVAGIGTDGILRPATVPVIPSVSQSGPSRIDSQREIFYQGYRDANGFEVATAPLSQYQSSSAYTVHNVSSDTAQIFPWINLDSAGNLYATWVDQNGNVKLSYSLISDPANDPAQGGVPATKWSPAIRINPPSLGSTIFPEIVAGDPGRVAIAFDATADWTGTADGAPVTARWATYLAESTNLLSANPTFQLGNASNRYDHVGAICSLGTTCPTNAASKDRSLLDMIDVSMDSNGRPSVVYTDNNNQYARDEYGATGLFSEGTPYVKVAHLTSGPSLFAGDPAIATTVPTQYRTTAAGNATWPNTAAGSGNNLQTADILGAGASLDVSGQNVVIRVDINDQTLGTTLDTDVTNDLATYNANRGTDVPGTREQYVVRWDTPGGSNGEGDTYYVAADVTGSGQPTYYGGKLNANNVLSNANSAVGVAYRPKTDGTDIPVTGAINGGEITFTVPLASIDAVAGGRMLSFAAYSLAGPADTTLSAAGTSDSSGAQIVAAMRTLDASAPLDVILTQPGPGSNLPEMPLLPLGVVIAGATGLVVRQRRRARG